MKNIIQLILFLCICFGSANICEANNNDSLNANVKDTNEQPIFDRAEVMPKFPDEPQAMMGFIMSNIKYDVKVEDGIPEKIVIKVIIDIDGKVINPKILKSSGNIKFDNEILRIIYEMPNWIPAKQRNIPVKCYYTIPFQFEFK